MTMEIETQGDAFLDESLPAMSYRDLLEGLGMIAAGPKHRSMAPYLVSALRDQSPFLTGQMTMFEILRTANCLADVGVPPVADG